MNSILAILQQIPIFSDYIVSGKFKELLKDEDFTSKISYQLHKLFRISMSMDNANLTPSSLRKICSEKDYVGAKINNKIHLNFYNF